MVLVPLMHYET